MNEATRVANLAMEKRGYVVMVQVSEFPEGWPKIGEIIGRPIPGSPDGSAGFLHGPVRVVAETDLADLLEQHRVVGMHGQNPRHPGERYFRLVAE